VHNCILLAKSENSLHEKIEEDGNLIYNCFKIWCEISLVGGGWTLENKI